jgi:hypothetical protein
MPRFPPWSGPEFLQTGVIETFRWLRVFGDTIFAAGAVALVIFVIGLRTGGSTGRQRLCESRTGLTVLGSEPVHVLTHLPGVRQDANVVQFGTGRLRFRVIG